MLPPAVNFHILRRCNLRCRFCFATFRDVPGQLDTEAALHVIDALAAAGARKLNFAGGEPTLHPDLPHFIRHAKRQGLTTSIVTNGARLARVLDACSDDLDWAGLSVDTIDESVQSSLGRGQGGHVRRSIENAGRCRAAGVRVKLNSVITRLNVHHDLAPLVRAMAPERWKVFQVLPMGGQNDAQVGDLTVSKAEFTHFVDRHRGLSDEGYPPIVEDNDAMSGSYAMVDPFGRFYGNATGRHVYSRPILEAGVDAALQEVGFVSEKLVARGGVYQWAG
jgi:radical S-adenosyl methionine domain-containing protein 2